MSMTGQHPKECPCCDAIFPWGDEREVPHDEGARQSFNAFWMLTWHMQDCHPEAFFTCGRQGEGPQGFGGPKAFWERDGTCSYCGSLRPELFFEAVEAGAEVGPTDKNYKAYIDTPNPDEGKPVYTGGRSGPVFEADGITRKPDLPDDLTDAEIAAGRYSRDYFGPAEATRHSKFYFQHLDAAGQARFIDLLNSGRMKVGYPGHFYRLPFFTRPLKAGEAA